MYLIEELISPLLTPFILMLSIRYRAQSIVDFLRNFTVEVTGVGDVCSFAQLDVRRHGSPEWLSGALSEAAGSEQAENGKTELSLLHFSVSCVFYVSYSIMCSWKRFGIAYDRVFCAQRTRNTSPELQDSQRAEANKWLFAIDVELKSPFEARRYFMHFLLLVLAPFPFKQRTESKSSSSIALSYVSCASLLQLLYLCSAYIRFILPASDLAASDLQLRPHRSQGKFPQAGG